MKYSIVCIGAGGTGSYFLKEVSRFLAGNGSIESLIVFDGDSVEKKNLARQSFMADDVGRNKATVMAEALNEAFDLKWRAYPEYLTSVDQVKKALAAGSRYGAEAIPIIVSCVDNHGARLVLEEAFKSFKNAAYFDSANEFTTGEVVYAYRVVGKTFGPPRSFYFPEIKDGDVRNRGEISCEELNRVEPQHIFTNMMAGNLLCTGVSNFLQQRSTPGVVYFNARQMDCRFVRYSAPEAAKPEKSQKGAERGSRGRAKKKGA